MAFPSLNSNGSTMQLLNVPRHDGGDKRIAGLYANNAPIRAHPV